MTLDAVLALVCAGDIARLNALAEAGELAFLTEADKNALTHAAARQGQAAMLRHLFEHHHLGNADADAQGRTLLHDAALSGDAQTVRLAMDQLGFDPMTGDAQGVTALEMAHGAAKQEAYDELKERLGFGLEDCYRNPILRGFHPDPSIVRVGNDYYMVHSTFVYLPGLPISHSKDLIHWTVIGHAVERLEGSGLAGLPGGYGYWAPDISYHNGRFYVVATLRRNSKPQRVQMFTSAEDPRGPWDAPKFIDIDGIDPSLFTDDDGQRYIVLNPGAMLAPISEDGELLAQPELIYLGETRIKPEGPHLLKKDGWYYLLLAEGGTGAGHMETAARARCIKGPYTPCPYGPILRRVDANNPIGRSGHGDLVQTPDGRWFMVYLCGRTVENDTVMGRETALDPVTWTADGWPMVNAGRGPSCLQRLPFSGTDGALSGNEEWLSPRGDIHAFAAIDGREIRMACGSDMATTAPCSVLVRRQREANISQLTTVDITDAAPQSVAGLIGYYDERSFFVYGLRRTAHGGELVLVQQIGEARSETILHADAGLRACLGLEGVGMSRRAWMACGVQKRMMAAFRTDYLADGGVKGGKRFTGATLGLAAVGEGEAVFTDYSDAMWE